jgi:anti-sigma-K factor RskA
LALLALGETAGTPAERDHVASCPQCGDEVADLARTVAVGRGSAAEDGTLMRPSDRVWQAIQAELGFGSAASAERAEVASVTPLHRPSVTDHRINAAQSGLPVGATAGSDAPGQGRGRRLLSLALAAVLALVVGVGLGFGLDRLLGPRQTILWTAELQALPAHAGSSGEAVVEEDADGNKTLVVNLSAPRPVNGSQEVWLIDRGVTTTRSLGHLTPSSNRFNIPADLDPRQFPIVDVSAEPPNDTEPRHSGNSIVRGTLNV